MKRKVLASLCLFLALLVGASFSPAALAAAAAGTTSAPIWRWEQVALPAGVAPYDVTDLAVDPVDSYHAFLATSYGLYESSNAGADWTRVASPTVVWASEVAFAPGDPQRLYARAVNIYRSDDGGDTWTTLAPPLSACGLAVAPSDADRLYARACPGQEPAVFRSDDGGQSWTAPAPAFAATLSSLVVYPLNADVLLGADLGYAYRSTDGGVSWAVVPVGVRYSGALAFDPQSPHTLYLGHWTGVLRSPDGGQTWQDSHCGHEFSALLASPLAPAEVLGGDSTSAWRLASSGDTWRVVPWGLPGSLQWLRRSAGDGRVLYVRTAAGELWRSVSYTLPFQAYLPRVERGQVTELFPAPAQQALDRLNLYRGAAGVPLLRLHAAMVAATQNHANYHMLNFSDPSAWTYGVHGEVEGKPGYTGRWPSDRFAATGFPGWGGSEVMAFYGDPITSTDDWSASIYGRAIVLDPEVLFIGYGYGASAATAVDVMDFGAAPVSEGVWSSGMVRVIFYPGAGQANLPTLWYANESPDPLPPDATRPVGYPATLHGIRGTLQVSWAELRDGADQVVPVHPNPDGCTTFNCYAMIAKSPLAANTTYTAHAVGTVGGVPFDHTWQFTTGAGGLAAPPGPVSRPWRQSEVRPGR